MSADREIIRDYSLFIYSSSGAISGRVGQGFRVFRIGSAVAKGQGFGSARGLGLGGVRVVDKFRTLLTGYGVGGRVRSDSSGRSGRCSGLPSSRVSGCRLLGRVYRLGLAVGADS